MKIAVVGAGIHGASSAKTLADRGHDVSLFDQFPLLHTRGSSHGESRIVRKAYPDAYYTELMTEAYPLWQELETQTGEQLLQEVGLLYFGREDSANLQAMTRGLADVGEPHKILDAATLGDLAPQLRLDRNEVAVFTPGAGWVDAAKCVSTTLKLAEHFGAKLDQNHPVTSDWLESNFDAYIVAPGAWIRDWVPDIQVQVTLQTVAFFDAQISGPVWIEDSELLAYGFPSHDPTLGAKAAYHSHGRFVDPMSADRSPDMALVGDLQEVLNRRYGIEQSALLKSYGCLYTNTPDEDFRVGRLGARGFYVSACSGHGFKFGPWIGRLMADFVEARQSPEQYPRFHRG